MTGHITADISELTRREFRILYADDPMPAIEHKTVAAPADPVLDIERRLLSGYCAVWHIVDRSKTRDSLQPGCFTKSIAARGGQPVPVRADHEPDLVIGETVSLEPDAYGLYATLRLHGDAIEPNNTGRLKILAAQMAAGIPVGLSIGWRAGETSTAADGTSRKVSTGNLEEVTLCINGKPASEGATLQPRVRSSADAAAQLAVVERKIAERGYADWQQDKRDHERRVRQLAAMPSYTVEPEPVHPSVLEHEQKVADLKLIDEIRQGESLRLRDWEFRKTWDARHARHGGEVVCACRGHDLWAGAVRLGQPA